MAAARQSEYMRDCVMHDLHDPATKDRSRRPQQQEDRYSTCVAPSTQFSLVSKYGTTGTRASAARETRNHAHRSTAARAQR